MATTVVVFKILFLVLIAHSFIAQQCSPALAQIIIKNQLSKWANLADGRLMRELNVRTEPEDESNRTTKVKTQVILEDLSSEYEKKSSISRRRRQAAATEAAILIEDTALSSSSSNQSNNNNSASEQTMAEERSISSSAAGGEPLAGLEERGSSTSKQQQQQMQQQAAERADVVRQQQPQPQPTPAAPVNYAELCYLSNGGSSITLTVNEATQVGSIIGTVEVNGDPSLEGGNVDLTDESSLVAVQRQAMNGDLSNNADQTGTTTGHPIQQQQQVAGNKQRRVLYRRSMKASEQLVVSANLSNHGPPARQRIARDPFSHSPPPPPPQPQAAALSANQMLGLISDYQGSASGHSASFYSLVASTTTPTVYSSSATTWPGGQQQQQQQQLQAIKLEPGTRNLILNRQLDKESPEGEQSLVINVRCTPRVAALAQALAAPEPGKRLSLAAAAAPTSSANQNNLESTSIPVRIIITDANDHAPEFIGQQPYVVNISETSPINAIVSRDFLAQDRDSAGPFSTLHYRVLEDGSTHSTLLQFANPLEPVLSVAGQLDYETLPSFAITIVAQDEGEPEPLSGRAQVQVNIIDFDDQNPKFLDEKYTLLMDETQQNLVGQNLQVLPRNLYAEDGDRGIGAPILYSFDQLGGFQHSQSAYDGSSSPDSTSSSSSSSVANTLTTDLEPNIDHYLHLNPTSGEIRLIRQWPSKWWGSPLTLVVRATQADNKDRYTLTTLTITRPVSNAAAQANHRSTSTGSQQQQQQQPVVQPGREELSDTAQQIAAASSGAGGGGSRQLEFSPNKLQIQVAENVAINEKIARVRARYKDTNLLAPLAAADQQSGGAADSQAVDLVGQDWPTGGGQLGSSSLLASLKMHGNKTRRTRLAELQQTANKRPINYQILGDQTDQSVFGINGLGEIFLKRHLDYEQRQEYKFQVLATYTKSSDTCQVQVIVLNVNDNKPKFTQPQYTFHLTETRLRSNIIGNVLAHDADLNDTIHYSLIGDHAHLFEINQVGQVSLRENIKQLNITSCQLTAQAMDSLAPPLHSHQARINLHVAASLVGRSINFDHLHQRNNHHHNHPATTASQHHHHQDQEAKLFNSRNLIDSRASDSNQVADWNNPALFSATVNSQASNGRQVNLREQQLISADNNNAQSSIQRSSVATVMSGLQHMVRSVNFFDMPFSSALLLSALLASLICLLMIVVVSMSVHLYRRRSKIRHRQHLAAAAHLRHAQISAALHAQPSSRYLPSSGPPSSSAGATNNNNNSGGTPFRAGSSSSPNSSPTNSTGAGNSPINFLATQQPAAPQATHRNHLANILNTNSNVSPLMSSDTHTNSNTMTHTNRVNQQASSTMQQAANNHINDTTAKSSEMPIKQQSNRGTTNHEPAASSQANRDYARNGSRQSQVSQSSLSARSVRSPQQAHNAHQATIGTLSGRLDSGPLSSLLSSLNETRPSMDTKYPASSQAGAEISLISSLSSLRSKRSYQSNTTDNSSVMHCGHYSVNASQSPQQQLASTTKKQQQLNDSSSSSSSCGRSSLANGETELKRRRQCSNDNNNSRQQSVEAAIKSLVRAGNNEYSQENELELTASNERLAGIVKQKRRKSSSSANHSTQPANELSVLTESKPGIKAYRKLANNKVAPEPADRSLVNGGGGKEQVVARNATGHSNPDSATASDASSPSAALVAANQQQLQQQYEGLMAMIRDPDLRTSSRADKPQVGAKSAQSRYGGPLSPPPPSAIKWPQGAAPSRVKKLTWDDELSLNNDDDCFVAADIQRLSAGLSTNCPMSPLSVSHQYPLRAFHATNDDQYAEQHFLFSNTCSPAPLSVDYTSFANGSNLIGAASATGGNQQPSYRSEAEQSSMLGQNNCFDYTIVQSSQFHVDAFASMDRPGSESILQAPPLPQSLSAQHHHHLLQQQQQQQQQAGVDKQRLVDGNYLYSNSFNSAQQAAPPTKQDLTLVTTAVL